VKRVCGFHCPEVEMRLKTVQSNAGLAEVLCIEGRQLVCARRLSQSGQICVGERLAAVSCGQNRTFDNVPIRQGNARHGFYGVDSVQDFFINNPLQGQTPLD
jgi:hypothetical protein